ncbi:hypothetical protein B0H14DRAFT_3130618 [Mycena olivaceomarginata]|nr:hypothetical protein B0H14DRAFT_3130618 [Mycena olivaceomarginata]
MYYEFRKGVGQAASVTLEAETSTLKPSCTVTRQSALRSLQAEAQERVAREHHCRTRVQGPTHKDASGIVLAAWGVRKSLESFAGVLGRREPAQREPGVGARSAVQGVEVVATSQAAWELCQRCGAAAAYGVSDRIPMRAHHRSERAGKARSFVFGLTLSSRLVATTEGGQIASRWSSGRNPQRKRVRSEVVEDRLMHEAELLEPAEVAPDKDMRGLVFVRDSSSHSKWSCY